MSNMSHRRIYTPEQLERKRKRKLARKQAKSGNSVTQHGSSGAANKKRREGERKLES